MVCCLAGYAGSDWILFASTAFQGTPSTLLDAAEHVALKNGAAARAQILDWQNING